MSGAGGPAPMAERLAFVAPGLSHGLGNAVFTIRNHARTLEMGEVGRARAAILRAGEQAHEVAEILAWMSSESAQTPVPRQVGVTLRQLLAVLRVPCRDYGLRTEVRHTSVDAPAVVDAGLLCRTVVDLARGICARLPVAFCGGLVIDVVRESSSRGAAVEVRLVADSDALPFPVDLRPLTGPLPGVGTEAGQPGGAVTCPEPQVLMLEIAALSAVPARS